MHSVHIVTPKGGGTRTTTALTLAGALSALGANVLVVDQDPNGPDGGATRWAQLAHAFNRQPAFVVSPALPRKVPDDQIVLFDHAPGRPAQMPNGLIVIPTPLDPGSVFSALRMRSQLGKRPSILVATRARLDRSEPRRILTQLGHPPVVKDRACYPNCFGSGQTIYDSQQPYARTARTEFQAVTDAVVAALGLSFNLETAAA